MQYNAVGDENEQKGLRREQERETRKREEEAMKEDHIFSFPSKASFLQYSSRVLYSLDPCFSPSSSSILLIPDLLSLHSFFHLCFVGTESSSRSFCVMNDTREFISLFSLQKEKEHVLYSRPCVHILLSFLSLVAHFKMHIPVAYKRQRHLEVYVQIFRQG